MAAQPVLEENREALTEIVENTGSHLSPFETVTWIFRGDTRHVIIR
jgi:hypothetical protein